MHVAIVVDVTVAGFGARSSTGLMAMRFSAVSDPRRPRSRHCLSALPAALSLVLAAALGMDMHFIADSPQMILRGG